MEITEESRCWLLYKAACRGLNEMHVRFRLAIRLSLTSRFEGTYKVVVVEVLPSPQGLGSWATHPDDVWFKPFSLMHLQRFKVASHTRVREKMQNEKSLIDERRVTARAGILNKSAHSSTYIALSS